MNTNAFNEINKIFHLQKDDYHYDWKANLESLDIAIQKRVQLELLGLGPLQSLIDDKEITEILVNGHDQVFYEKNGSLLQHNDHFYSPQTYLSILERLSQSCGTYVCREKPFIEAQYGNLRITIIYQELSRGNPLLSIRIQPEQKWTLYSFLKFKFMTDEQFQLITQLFDNKNNFLVVGETGCGKTSLLQSLLQQMAPLERAVIIEDTQELQTPNQASISLLTRQDPAQTVPDITMDDLLKRSLRLRPDRLIVGEVRGPEAKSLLLALSSGHKGSFSSLHASSAQDALLRLELLIQMGAPQWSLNSIRKLILKSLDFVIVLEKNKGLRKIKGVYKINSLEESGFTISKLDE